LTFIGCIEPEPTTVTGVVVSPATPGVIKGGTVQFSAAVSGTNNPAQTVTWSIVTDKAAGTNIDAAGLLTVAANEDAATITVRATSTVDTSKYGQAVAAVSNPPLTGTVTIDGTLKVGITLHVNTSALDSSGPFSYAWTSADNDTAAGTPVGTDSDEYELTAADEGKYIRVTVTSEGYTGSITSNVYGPVIPLPDTQQIFIHFTGFYNEDIDLTEDGDNALVKGNYSQELTVTVNDNYDMYGWYVNGEFRGSGETMDSITVSGGDFYQVGPHNITVVVKKDEAFYSKLLTFMVVEEN